MCSSDLIHDWGPVFELAGKGGSELVELTVNYRTPAEVMAFAVAEVSRHGRAVSAPSAIRFSGVAPQRRAGSVGTLTDLLAQARAAVGDAGTVVAVVPEALARPHDEAFLTATQTKGLEFDGVIVFDPAAIASESPFGATRLYVALTRTTRLLWVVHPVPDGDPTR